MSELNEIWSIEKHKHGGFNLIETKHGVNQKTGKPTISTRSYYYPKLEICAGKMLEQNFNNDADCLATVVEYMDKFTNEITAQLKEVMK